jgi:hypothetical protein
MDSCEARYTDAGAASTGCAARPMGRLAPERPHAPAASSPDLPHHLEAGEMRNSNSVISWLIARSEIDLESIQPPAGGRAPGWRAGLVVARGQELERRMRAASAPTGSASNEQGPHGEALKHPPARGGTGKRPLESVPGGRKRTTEGGGALAPRGPHNRK